MILRASLVLVAGAVLAPASAADTIHLKGGGKLRNATVVAEKDDTVVIEVRVGKGSARVIVARADVLRIERDAPDPKSPQRPAELDKAFKLLRERKPVQA